MWRTCGSCAAAGGKFDAFRPAVRPEMVPLAAETDLAMKSTSIDREELLTDLLLKLAAG